MRLVGKPAFRRRRYPLLRTSRLQRLLDIAQVLQYDRYGIKVAQLPSGAVVKLFRRQRRLSSAAWAPAAQRFVNNATALARLGIPTVQVRRLFYCPERARYGVVYRPLVGSVLRESLSTPARDADWNVLARFVAELHQRGVYFRSLHSGNIVCLPRGGFGLIDVADLRVSTARLGVLRRARNLRPLLRDTSARSLRSRQVFGDFLGAYLAAAGLAGSSRRLLHSLAWRQWRRASAQSSVDSGSDSTSASGMR